MAALNAIGEQVDVIRKSLGKPVSLAAAAIALSILPCAGSAADTPYPCLDASAEPREDPAIEPWGVDLTARDTTIDPGDDFDRYANGAWLDNYEMPKERSVYGAFEIRSECAERQIHGIITDLQHQAGRLDGEQQKLLDLYASWMNVKGKDARAQEAVAPYLAEIDAIENRDDLLALFARPEYASPVRFYIYPKAADPTRYTVVFTQGGLTLPSREYYLGEQESYAGHRRAYRDYIIELHKLAGIESSAGRADRIIALETALARSHWAPARRRDIQATNNPMNLGELAALAPEFDWPSWVRKIGVDSVDTYTVHEKSAVTAAGDLIASIPISTWKEYLAFHFLNSNASYISTATDNAHHNFFSKRLRGTTRQFDHWQRGVDFVTWRMGDAIGKLYVERHLSQDSVEQMREMVENMRTAFRGRALGYEWMDDATRQEALAKIATLEARIGRPRQWVDYSDLKVDANDLLGNVQRAKQFQFDRLRKRLPGPAYRGYWTVYPQIATALYDRPFNQLTFPAAILQPPFFDPYADPAVNYGAIGSGIGHEMSHAFDDRGRHFDARGRLRDWWTESSAKAFEARAKKLGEQFSGYEVHEGAFINPELTMGENIADLGGVQLAYVAYRLHVAQHGEPPIRDGLTGDQRFFLSWAQIFRTKYREERLREQVLTATHSPGKYRINGVFANIDGWYEAFDVGPDDALYIPPEDRVKIW